MLGTLQEEDMLSPALERFFFFLNCKNAMLKAFEMTTVMMNPEVLCIVYKVHWIHTPVQQSLFLRASSSR